MGRFRIESPDGREIVVEGDGEPTDEEAEEIFKSLPRKVDRVSLAEKKGTKKALEGIAPEPRKKAKESGFEPSVTLSLLSAIKAMTKKIEDSANVKPPVVKVEAPVVNVAPPEVNITNEAPTEWKVDNIKRERDDDGIYRITSLRIKAVK